MQQVMPAKFLKLRLIAEVPRSEYLNGKTPKNLKDTEKRTSFIKKLRLATGKKIEKAPDLAPHSYKFNVAAWLKANRGLPQPISLHLRFEDSTGAYVIMVEETHIDNNLPVMFSGLVEFKTKGTLKSLQVCVSGMSNDETIIVDELFVQKQENEIAGKILQERSA